MSSPLSAGWRRWFFKQLPSAENLAAVPWLRPVAHHLAQTALWRLTRRALPRSVAIGIFWAFATPIAQVVFATAHCIWWRANIPVAAALTFITNPFTLALWLYAAYRVGAGLLGMPLEAHDATDGLLGLLQAFGWPALVGMAFFAIVGAGSGYVAARIGVWLWFHRRVAVRARRKARLRDAA